MGSLEDFDIAALLQKVIAFFDGFSSDETEPPHGLRLSEAAVHPDDTGCAAASLYQGPHLSTPAGSVNPSRELISVSRPGRTQLAHLCELGTIFVT